MRPQTCTGKFWGPNGRGWGLTIHARCAPAVGLPTPATPAGRYDEAATQFEDILRERSRALGPMHPDTLRSRGSLANTYACLGRYDDAEALHRQTVQDREEVLGPVHPRTELSRVRLGAVLKVSQKDKPASDSPPSEKEHPK